MKNCKITFKTKYNNIFISNLYSLPIFLKLVTVCSMPAKLDKVDIKFKLAVSKRLKEVRKETGKTQEAFAHGSGRDKQAYNKNETGKGTSIYTLNKFCIENEITLLYFFDSPLFK